MSTAQFKNLLDKSVEVTAYKIAQFPKYGVYAHAMDQLNYILTIVSQGKTPTNSEKESINLGLMAVKELETTDPEYCDLLCEVDYYFKKL